ncbi:glutathione S-transferase [Marinobacter sp. ANT_B65]|uniref:glutathione S-transferase n=1 Tax=Marinobacter sp. ANT_B65 TaxID=2039467 RepID=UPI000BBE8901|nr:glutathione S-transferase [Marinobacter sp. ANT_B65]PCM43387.1 glutathione S-transferase [Marinobacter sp. ANT_B65]
MFQLYYASTSPYVRKVMAAAHCLGLTVQIEKLESAANPVKRDDRIARFNPLAKVPAMCTDDGTLLYDSRVICEYLDAQSGHTLIPADGSARWSCLTRQALGDGLLDAALLARYELTLRPEEKQWEVWRQAQLSRIDAALAEINIQAPQLSRTPDDLGLITLGCALGYLDFRFPGMDWRALYPQAAEWFAEFDEHPAMLETRPFT